MVVLNRHNDHLRGKACYKCGVISSSINRRDNNEKFIKKARIIHGDMYIYDNINYISRNTKIEIICKIY